MAADISDDYASLDAGRYRFYYGYESTICPVHKADDCECEKVWAFVAYENGEEKGRLPQTRLGDHSTCAEMLLRGIAAFGNWDWQP